MITWAEPKPLPRDVLDPSSASLLPQSAKNAQPFFVDIATLPEAVAEFSKAIFESPAAGIEGLFSFLAGSVSYNFNREEGFVRPKFDEKRAAIAKTLIGPDVDRKVLHENSAVRGAYENLAKQNLFVRPNTDIQKSTKPQNKSAVQPADPVSMGIADFSIAFLNRRFMKANGETRFEMLWIQDRIPLAEFQPMFPSYQLFGIGTFMMRQDINNLIAHFTTNGALDEVAAYAAFSKPPLGKRDSWALREGHGTAILDHMAGAEPGTHDDDRPIYGVELPTSVLLDTSGQNLLAPLLLGLVVMSFTSLFFTPPVSSGGSLKGAPLVINASLAFTGGPDNGTDKSGFAGALSSLMSALQTLPHKSLTLTIPTGNHRQDRIHARFDAGPIQSIAWALPPDDNTSNTLEIYVDNGSDLDHFAITPPGGTAVTLPPAALPAAGFYVDLVQNGQIIARLAHQQGFGPKHYTLTTAPTARRTIPRPMIQSGTWDIALQSCNAPIDIWVRRDDRLAGFPASGRQSWLVDEAYLAYDETGDTQGTDLPRAGAPQLKVYREGTGSVLLDAMNGGANGIVGVAGLQNDGLQPYRFSGDRRAVGAQAPQTATAEVSRLLGGPLAAARKSGAVSRPAGTSIASAIYARQVADTI